MNLYTDYINEIEERKNQGLHPKPIDDGALLAEIIEQIKDLDHEHREDSLKFFIYNTLPGTTSAAGVKAQFLKQIILGDAVVAEISPEFAFELLSHMKGGPSVEVLLDLALGNDEAIAKKINSAVFPGLQGGPLMHVIAAKAVAFGEALRPEFKDYSQRVVDNARALADTLISRGFDIVAGGTDTHLMLVDLRSKGLTGDKAEAAMENARMTSNKNGVPFDPEKPTVTSGVRLGTPAGTTRGFGTDEFKQIGNLIADVLDGLAANPDDNSAAEQAAAEAVGKLCADFPIYETR